jgi:hypothetical protein
VQLNSKANFEAKSIQRNLGRNTMCAALLGVAQSQGKENAEEARTGMEGKEVEWEKDRV